MVGRPGLILNSRGPSHTRSMSDAIGRIPVPPLVDAGVRFHSRQISGHGKRFTAGSLKWGENSFATERVKLRPK
jgi:hypothetical protein